MHDVEDELAQTRILLARAREGDRSALESAFEHVRPKLERWVALRFGAHLKQRLDIEDIVQETLLGAFNSLEGFEPEAPGSFFKWLRRIADNRIRDAAAHLHAKKRSPEREQRLERSLHASWTTASRAAVRREEQERLLRTLATLKEDDRDVIRLVRLEGLSYAEAGEQLGLSAKSTGVRLVRALGRLRAQMNRLEADGSDSAGW